MQCLLVTCRSGSIMILHSSKEHWSREKMKLWRGGRKRITKFFSLSFKPVFQHFHCPCTLQKPVAIIIFVVRREWGAALGFQINYLCANFTAGVTA